LLLPAISASLLQLLLLLPLNMLLCHPPPTSPLLLLLLLALSLLLLHLLSRQIGIIHCLSFLHAIAAAAPQQLVAAAVLHFVCASMPQLKNRWSL
jgi:hypothetical protein